MKKYAFTLAEVLITLGIIGIIAAISLPVLTTNLQRSEWSKQAKKQYTNLSQAYTTILNENSGTFAGVCTLATASQIRNCFTQKLVEKMKSVKTCLQPFTSDCFTRNYSFLSDSFAPYTSGGIDGGLILADGTSIWTVLWYPDCDSGYFDPYKNTTLFNYCGWIAFDVNGFKKPNRVGHDIFGVGVFNNKLMPYGMWNGNTKDCSPSGRGYNCLYNVITNVDY